MPQMSQLLYQKAIPCVTENTPLMQRQSKEVYHVKHIINLQGGLWPQKQVLPTQEIYIYCITGNIRVQEIFPNFANFRE